MIGLVRDNPLVAFAIAVFRTRVDRVRDRARTDRGASAVNWLVIAAICVLAAVAMGVAVTLVVHANQDKIRQGVNLPS